MKYLEILKNAQGAKADEAKLQFQVESAAFEIDEKISSVKKLILTKQRELTIVRQSGSLDLDNWFAIEMQIANANAKLEYLQKARTELF